MTPNRTFLRSQLMPSTRNTSSLPSCRRRCGTSAHHRASRQDALYGSPG